MYIDTVTKAYPLRAKDIQSANPNTSFPSPFVPLAKYVLVQRTERPVYDPITHGIRELPPVKVGAKWEQVWEVYGLDAATVAANQAAADKALYDSIVQATQERLDTFAQSRGYDSMLSACTYASSSVTKFSTEGQYCVDARDATWAKLIEILGEITAGTRPRPSGYADIESDLPPLVWP